MAFYALEKLNHLYDGYQKAFRIAGHDLLLLQQDGCSLLIENRCPHMDAALTHATQGSGILRCRAHGIEFRLSDGRACGPMAEVLPALKFFPIAYDGNTLGVDL